jgi:fatty-acyl-CoA synthase
MDQTIFSREEVNIMNIAQWMSKQALYSPDKTAICFKEEKISYREFNQTINRLTHYFERVGIAKGDRVAVLMYNHPCFLETYFACAKSGTIFVPLNFRLTVEELEYQVGNCTPKLIIFSEELRTTMDKLGEKMDLSHIRLSEMKDREDDSSGYDNLKSAVAQCPDDELYVEIDSEDPHMIMYSSGTMGYPKGIVMPHRKAFWNTMNSLHALDISRQDVTLCVLPFFHSGGLNVLTIPTLYQGGTVVIHSKFDEISTLEAIQDYQCTSITAVPTVFERLIPEIRKGKYDLSSLRFAISGGAPLHVEVIETYKGFDIRLIQVYGTTETSIFCCMRSEDAFSKMGFSGQPMMHVDLLVVDENHKPLGLGKIGEAAVKGPQVMTGLWNDPEATREVLSGDVFYTGDLVVMEEGNYVKVVGRKKDMIISGGENIYPAEVERVISLHPSVEEVAVIGCKDDKWGEIGVAVVALRKNHVLTLEDLMQFCRGKLAGYKIPKGLNIVKELPRTATGKVRKDLLQVG